MPKHYLTKYALARGIVEVEIQPSSIDDELVRVVGDSWSLFRLGRDIFPNPITAKADAEKRRTKKIASLQKQIAKLEKLNFSHDL